MKRRPFARRLAVPALVVATAAGVSAVGAPAEAATAPTAVLSNGTVTITGTAARDVIAIDLDANRLAVDFGSNGTVDAQFQASGVQRVSVLARRGNDGVSFTGTGAVPVTIGGGGGDDGIGVVGDIGSTGSGDAATTINGNDGNDGVFAATPGPITIQTGAGDDLVDGGGAGVGHETISLGDGADRFRSSLNTFIGPRSDVVDGGGGRDALDIEGTFASEAIHLSASAGHLLVNQDVIDSDNVEDVKYVSFGGLDGGDSVSVNDLSGTDVLAFTADFSVAGDGAAPENAADQLTVRGTDGVDNVTVSSSGPRITVAGLVPTVTAVQLAAPEDVLEIDTGAGRDVVDSSGLQRGLVQLIVI